MVANIEERAIEKRHVLSGGSAGGRLGKFVDDFAGVKAKADNSRLAGRVAIWDKIKELMHDCPTKSWQAFLWTVNQLTFIAPLTNTHETARRPSTKSPIFLPGWSVMIEIVFGIVAVGRGLFFAILVVFL